MNGERDAAPRPGPAGMAMGTAPGADELAGARVALRARQGSGARYDASAAPARELYWARLGTAYFARQLNELSDAALWAASSRSGWTRRRVIAAVGLEGRAIAQAIALATSGPSEEFADVGAGALDLAETLPATALRHLVTHAAIHLDVTWRDLTDAQWDLPIEGVSCTIARESVFARARSLWASALDLRASGRLADAPPDFVAALEV